MFREVLLDARELEHPEPFELGKKALDNLQNSEYFVMRHRMIPKMLTNSCSKDGFAYMVKPIENGVDVFFYKYDNEELKAHLSSICK
ncbi:MAG: hypothetical protein U9N42_04625 [Campylobacterota bacterium]|nr:hypothetical protein [Campylobacterota bacterium]